MSFHGNERTRPADGGQTNAPGQFAVNAAANETLLMTLPLEPRAGSALDPLVEEVTWVAFRLLSASPRRVVSEQSVGAATSAFDYLVEEAWLPGRVAVLADLRLECVPANRLVASLAVGVMGPADSTRVEAAAIASLLGARLNARHLPYRVGPISPIDVLDEPGGEPRFGALIRQREVTIEGGDDHADVSLLSRWNPTVDPWSAVARALLTRDCPTSVRATVLPTEVTVADRMRLEQAMDSARDLRRDGEGRPDVEFQADRVISTLIDLRASLSTPVMCVELAVTSGEPLPELFLRSVGACFTSEADVIRRQGHIAVAAQRLIIGGFEVESAPPGLWDALRAGLPLRGGVRGRELRDLVTLFENPIGWPIPINHPIPTIDAGVIAELPVPPVMAAGLLIGTGASGTRVHLPPEARHRHTLITGATGTGKSTILAAAAIADVREGRPFLVLDCHGSVADRVVAHADELGRRVAVIDVTDPVTDRLALYPRLRRDGRNLAAVEKGTAYLCDAVSSSLSQPELWMGPRGRLYGRAIGFVSAFRGIEFSEAVDLVLDEQRLVEVVRQPGFPVGVRDALLNLHSRSSEASDLRNWAVSKFGVFTTVHARRIFAPAGGGPLVADLVAERVPIVVNLARLPTSDASLIGHVIISAVLDAALDRPVGTGPAYTAYIDEAHRFPVASLERVTAEGRKFGLSLALATQSLGQLERSLNDSVSSAGVKIAFRQSPGSADQLATLMDLTPLDLVDLPDLNAYVKITGHPTCSVRVDPYGPCPPLRDKTWPSAGDGDEPDVDQDEPAMGPSLLETWLDHQAARTT